MKQRTTGHLNKAVQMRCDASVVSIEDLVVVVVLPDPVGQQRKRCAPRRIGRFEAMAIPRNTVLDLAGALVLCVVDLLHERRESCADVKIMH